MKRSLLILVLSIAGSLLPNILLAGNVKAPSVSSVSLLAVDAAQVVQAKNGGVTNMLTLFKTKPSKAQKKLAPKVTTEKVVEKTKTKEVSKTLEEFRSLKKATLPHMVQAWGYNRKTDRTRLANEVGIKNYVGTLQQNTLIKNFLLSKIEIKDRAVPKSVPDLETDAETFKSIQKLPLHKSVKYRGYIREVDREKIADELGIKQYVGSKGQNLLIKKYFQKKITVKKKRNL